MIARSLRRTQPIQFSPSTWPEAVGDTRSPQPPVAWGNASRPALVLPVEDPRALYAVAHTWQGHKPAAPEADTSSRTASATSATRCTVSASPAARPSPLRPEASQPVAELAARYVGQGSLCVRSSVTGRHYRFQGHGHTLRIDKHDQMLMRRISDVELV